MKGGNGRTTPRSAGRSRQVDAMLNSFSQKGGDGVLQPKNSARGASVRRSRPGSERLAPKNNQTGGGAESPSISVRDSLGTLEDERFDAFSSNTPAFTHSNGPSPELRPSSQVSSLAATSTAPPYPSSGEELLPATWRSGGAQSDNARKLVSAPAGQDSLFIPGIKMRFFFPDADSSFWEGEGPRAAQGVLARSRPFMRHFDVYRALEEAQLRPPSPRKSRHLPELNRSANGSLSARPHTMEGVRPKSSMPEKYATDHRAHRMKWVPADVDLRTMYYMEGTFVADKTAWEIGLHRRQVEGAVDFNVVVEFIRNIQPKTKLDALPMFYLCQNILCGVLEDKMKHERRLAKLKDAVDRIVYRTKMKKEMQENLEAEKGEMDKVANEAEMREKAQMELIASLQDKLAKKEREIQRFSSELASSTERLEATEKELARVRQVTDTFRRQFESAKSENDKLKGKLAETSMAVQGLSADTDKKRRENEVKEMKLEEQRWRRVHHFQTEVENLNLHPLLNPSELNRCSLTAEEYAVLDKKRRMLNDEDDPSASASEDTTSTFTTGMGGGGGGGGNTMRGEGVVDELDAEALYIKSTEIIPVEKEAPRILADADGVDAITLSQLAPFDLSLDFKDLFERAVRAVQAYTCARTVYVGERSAIDDEGDDYIGEFELMPDDLPPLGEGKATAEEVEKVCAIVHRAGGDGEGGDEREMKKNGAVNGTFRVGVKRYVSVNEIVLEVELIEASALPVMDRAGLERYRSEEDMHRGCDAYVKVTYGGETLTSRTVYDTLDPTFNQRLLFKFSKREGDELEQSSVHFAVFDEDSKDELGDDTVTVTTVAPPEHSFLVGSVVKEGEGAVYEAIQSRRTVFVPDVSERDNLILFRREVERLLRKDRRPDGDLGKVEGSLLVVPIIMEDVLINKKLLAPNGEDLTYVGIDYHGVVAGVLVVDTVSPLPGAPKLEEDEVEFVEAVAKVLGKGMAMGMRSRAVRAEIISRGINLTDAEKRMRQYMSDIKKAKRMKGKLEKTINDIGSAYISEIKHYRDPPQVVQKVISLAYFILIVEDTTPRQWPYLRSRLQIHRSSPDSFINLLVRFNPATPAEAKNSSKYRIIKEQKADFDMRAAKKASKALTMIMKWIEVVVVMRDKFSKLSALSFKA